MNSRPINLARRWRSAGSPILVGKIDRVLQRHEHGRRRRIHRRIRTPSFRTFAVAQCPRQKQGGGRRASGGPANADTHGRPRRTAAAYASTSIPAVIICASTSIPAVIICRRRSSSAAHHLRNYFCVSACIFSCAEPQRHIGAAARRQQLGSGAAARQRGGGCSAAAEAAARRRDLRPTRWCSGAPREIDERENILHHPNVLRCPPRAASSARPPQERCSRAPPPPPPPHQDTMGPAKT